MNASHARQERRKAAAEIARTLIGQAAEPGFDLIRSPLCPIDVAMVAGAPWFRDALERDFVKDEAGYRKIGGGSNTPDMPYFFRSAANLIHFLKRQNLYFPRGSNDPEVGMVCFFDWEERGRFNFTPDRSGIITQTSQRKVHTVVLALNGKIVEEVTIVPGSPIAQALIGYADLP